MWPVSFLASLLRYTNSTKARYNNDSVNGIRFLALQTLEERRDAVIADSKGGLWHVCKEKQSIRENIEMQKIQMHGIGVGVYAHLIDHLSDLKGMRV